MKCIPTPVFGSLVSRVPLAHVKEIRPINIERKHAYTVQGLLTRGVDAVTWGTQVAH